MRSLPIAELAAPSPLGVAPEAAHSSRPRLLLYLAPYTAVEKNAVAATLAWMAEAVGWSFEVYYDAIHFGRHYGTGNPDDSGLYPGQTGLGMLTGGLVGGGRHLEAAAMALARFETTVLCSGEVAFSNLLAALEESTGARVLRVDQTNLLAHYDAVFSALGLPWPRLAVMVDRAPAPGLEGVDAYCHPEIFHRRALGIEAGITADDLRGLRQRGVREILTCGASADQLRRLASHGFEVSDLGVVQAGDDYASVTARLARRWSQFRRGWVIGDPTVASYWLPTACRERRSSIYGVPHAAVLEELRAEIAGDARLPVLGRQFDDTDFFTLSRLGQSFQVIDPCRPPLPVLQTLPTRWAGSVPDPAAADPTDEQLRQYAREGRVLTSLVFWTGMIRETENLFALADLIALTGLRAGLVLTVPSLTWRPSPLDLLTVPREQGGLFPHAEILLGSCGTGVAIESLLSPAQLGAHLAAAREDLIRAGVPRAWWPQGWWATMDPPMVQKGRWRRARRIRWSRDARYRVQVRFHRSGRSATGGEAAASEHAPPASLRRSFGRRLRGSSMEAFFEAYRPYENFEAGALNRELAATVQQAGLSYMLSKSGFGRPPTLLYQQGDFAAINYTAGRWDGWTPFETVNDVSDLRAAERRLLRRGKPGWLLGTIDSCLWTFSGELWQRAPRLHEIARFTAAGGDSGRLVNVLPRVLARYARVIAELNA